MSALNDQVKDAWVAHIAVHSGVDPEVATPLLAEIRSAVLSMGLPTPPPDGGGDFAKLEDYRAAADAERFTRDVTYQLYYVTECLIWLWKRLPQQILVRREGSNARDAQIDKLLDDLNAGTPVRRLDASLIPELPDKRQGERLPTPDRGVEAIVKRSETAGGAWREAALRGNSHEPPPPPPVWPAE